MINFLSFQIQKLSPEHDLSDFCCGDTTDEDDQELTNFLKENALKEQLEQANVSHVAIEKDTKKVIGYVTTLTDKLRVSTKEKGDMHLTSKYYDFPSIKVGRLAVDKNHENKKVGTILLQFVRGLALESSENVGCRFLIVDSYPKSVDFYLKNDFIKNLIQDQRKTKIVKENSEDEPIIDPKYSRDTISLRYDLLNPLKDTK